MNNQLPPFVPQTLEQVCKYLKRAEPALWAGCTPKFFDGVQAWGSYKLYAAGMVAMLAWVRDNPIDIPLLQRNIYMAGCASAKAGHELIFVGPSEIRRVLNTDYSSPLRWDELPRPSSAGVFVIPPGVIHNVGYGDVDFVAYAFLEPTVDYWYDSGFPGFTVAEPSLVIWTMLPNAPSFTAFQIGYGQGSPTLLQCIGETPDAFLPTCTRLVFGLLLDSARVVPGASMKVKTRSGRELWRPHLLEAGVVDG